MYRCKHSFTKLPPSSSIVMPSTCTFAVDRYVECDEAYKYMDLYMERNGGTVVILCLCIPNAKIYGVYT